MNDDGKIRCACGKLLARVRDDGKIMVWCKHCKKEVLLEIEAKKQKCPVCNGSGRLPTGFYGTGSCSNADIRENRFPELCHTCMGNGYI